MYIIAYLCVYIYMYIWVNRGTTWHAKDRQSSELPSRNQVLGAASCAAVLQCWRCCRWCRANDASGPPRVEPGDGCDVL